MRSSVGLCGLGPQLDGGPRIDPRSIFLAEGYDRLRRAKARYDPTSMFLANHAVSPLEA